MGDLARFVHKNNDLETSKVNEPYTDDWYFLGRKLRYN